MAFFGPIPLLPAIASAIMRFRIPNPSGIRMTNTVRFTNGWALLAVLLIRLSPSQWGFYYMQYERLSREFERSVARRISFFFDIKRVQG
jgi:hypothetical protein